MNDNQRRAECVKREQTACRRLAAFVRGCVSACVCVLWGLIRANPNVHASQRGRNKSLPPHEPLACPVFVLCRGMNVKGRIRGN